MIGHVTRCKDSFDAGPRAAGLDGNVPVGVHVYLALDELGVGVMTDGNEGGAAVDYGLLLGLAVGDLDPRQDGALLHLDNMRKQGCVIKMKRAEC